MKSSEPAPVRRLSRLQWEYVLGKGKKARRIVVSDDMLAALRRYRTHLQLTPSRWQTIPARSCPKPKAAAPSRAPARSVPWFRRCSIGHLSECAPMVSKKTLLSSRRARRTGYAIPGYPRTYASGPASMCVMMPATPRWPQSTAMWTPTCVSAMPWGKGRRCGNSYDPSASHPCSTERCTSA